MGGVRPPPVTLFTITYKVAVYAPAERADTLLLFHLYPYMYSVVLFFESWRQSGAPVIVKIYHSLNTDGEVELQKPVFHFTYKLPFSECRWRSGAPKTSFSL
jgi:hypothetical protein